MTTDDSPRPLARSEFVGNDPVRIQEHLHAVYGRDTRLECVALGDSGRYHHIRYAAAGLALEQITFAGDATLVLDTIRDDIMAWVHAGTLSLHSDNADDADDSVGRGELRMVRAGTRSITARTVDARLTLVHLTSALPRTASATAGLSPHSQGAADLVKRTISYVTDVFNAEETAHTHALVDALAALLRAAAHSGFVSGAHGNGREVSDTLPSTLQAALTYIETNAARRISLADLAAEAYATPRTVQYLFRRHLDTTPTAYLRRVRLAAARQELLTSHRSTTTVTATAARWGFGHTGRFAVLYRGAYGESPHETLAR